MTRRLFTLAWVVISPCRLTGQLDLLTLREAEGLIERIPEIAKLQKDGECPGVSPWFEGREDIYFQVRRTCGPGSGQWIGNYKVNRRTGEVVLGGDDPLPVADAEGKAYARQLVERAQRRVLSSSEARCVANEAAQARPGWNAAEGVVSVKPFGKSVRSDMSEFTTTLTLRTEPIEVGAMLTVDLRSARVRDDQTGGNLTSKTLGELVSKLYALRNPVWLTDAEAASVALPVPRVAKNLGSGCKLTVGGAFYSHQAVLGVTCEEKAIRESNLLVDLATGSMADPETAAPLDLPETRRLANKFLSEARERRARLQSEAAQTCPD